jgi:hypothetical protein
MQARRLIKVTGLGIGLGTGAYAANEVYKTYIKTEIKRLNDFKTNELEVEKFET